MSKALTLDEIKALPDMSSNQPNPLRIQLWGKNRVMGLVVQNEEIRSKSGIVLADSNMTQSLPHACKIVKASEVITDEFPTLQRLKAEYDPKSEGEVIDGPYVSYNEYMTAQHFIWPRGEHQQEWIILSAHDIRGGYVPRLTTVGEHYERGEWSANDTPR